MQDEFGLETVPSRDGAVRNGADVRNEARE
jgi:hypothetical protein